MDSVNLRCTNEFHIIRAFPPSKPGADIRLLHNGKGTIFHNAAEKMKGKVHNDKRIKCRLSC